MVNQTITLVVEKTQEGVFIKPTTNKEQIVNGSNVVQFNPPHVCDENDCDCILLLKEVNSNIYNVGHLNLTMCMLTSIPDGLSELPLISLDLSHNLLKNVPNCLLKGLDTLENLNLSNNYLKEFEQIPKCASTVRILNLERNNIAFIPIWIVHVKTRNLVELYYSCNTLGKTNESLYSKVFACSLRKVILQNCFVLNENVPFIKSIPTLQHLDISNNVPLTPNTLTDPDELFDNPSWKNTLEVLNVSSLRIAFLPDGMCALLRLKELYVPENKIYRLPDFIGNLVNLEILDASNNSICFLPSTFSGLINLRTLNFHHNSLSNCKVLDSLTNLSILDLYENDLDECDLDIVKYDCLDLEKNYFSTCTLDSSYVKKRERYRQEFDLTDRQIGFYEEQSDDASDVYNNDAKRFSELDLDGEDVDDDRNVTPIDTSFEEECWDDVKFQSHPEVTSSDDEFMCFYPLKKQVPKTEENLDHLLDSLYEDAD